MLFQGAHSNHDFLIGYLFEIHSKYECREVEIESIETNPQGLKSVRLFTQCQNICMINTISVLHFKILWLSSVTLPVYCNAPKYKFNHNKLY